MKTPDTKAGKITERVMVRVRQALPKLDTHTYNRVYEAVLEEMTLQLGKPGDFVLHKGGGGMML